MLHPNLKALLREPSVSFNAENHTYPHKTTGELYKGCTTIANLADKPFLPPWYTAEMAKAILRIPFEAITTGTPQQFASLVNESKKAAVEIKDQAAKDGTAAHDWIESYVATKIDPAAELLPTPERKEPQNAINAFIGWAKRHEIIWLASEEILSDDQNRIAGRIDAVAIVDGIPSIVDFKTSNQISESYPLQCAGYDLMLRAMGFTVRQWIILRIPKDGGPAETLTVSDEHEMEFFRETFLHHLDAHKYQVYIENHYKQGGKITTHKEIETPATGTMEKVEETKAA